MLAPRSPGVPRVACAQPEPSAELGRLLSLLHRSVQEAHVQDEKVEADRHAARTDAHAIARRAPRAPSHARPAYDGTPPYDGAHGYDGYEAGDWPYSYV